MGQADRQGTGINGDLGSPLVQLQYTGDPVQQADRHIKIAAGNCLDQSAFFTVPAGEFPQPAAQLQRFKRCRCIALMPDEFIEPADDTVQTFDAVVRFSGTGLPYAALPG